MADFTAKDVQALRQSTGAGMMDAKKALVENDGDPEAAAQWLREKGIAKSASRSDRENSEGIVVARVEGATGFGRSAYAGTICSLLARTSRDAVSV